MYSGSESAGASATKKQQQIYPSPSMATLCPPLVSTVSLAGGGRAVGLSDQSEAGEWTIGDAGGGCGGVSTQLAMPNLMMAMSGGLGSSAVNIAQSFRVGGVRDMIDVEQVQVEVKRFFIPNSQTQSGAGPPQHHNPFYHGASEISSLFSRDTSRRLFSGASDAPNLKRKVEFFRNSNFDNLSIQKESLCPNSFYQDSGSQYSSSEVFSSRPEQCSLFNEVASDSATNFCSENIYGKENKETLFRCRKRKDFCRCQISSMSWTAATNGTENNYLQSFSDHVFLSPELNSPVPVQIPRPVVPSYSQPQSRYQAYCGENLFTTTEDKEMEQNGWIKILQKELRNSDVSSLGRIVLPKKEAEANLPPLLDKDGLNLQMLDMIFPTKWEFKYRFWPNNKSRMYIMENTGDFIKAHKLQKSDFLIIYRDMTFGDYIVRGKKSFQHPILAHVVEWKSKGQGNVEQGDCNVLPVNDYARNVNQQLCQNGRIDSRLTTDFSMKGSGADSFQMGHPVIFLKEPSGSAPFHPQIPEHETEKTSAFRFQT